MTVLPNVEAAPNSALFWTMDTQMLKNYSPAHNCLKWLSVPLLVYNLVIFPEADPEKKGALLEASA